MPRSLCSAPFLRTGHLLIGMVQLVSDCVRQSNNGQPTMTSKVFPSVPLISLAFIFSTLLSGCLSPVTLTRAVIAYDDAITESQSKQLLVNIARAQHHQPIHF